MRTQICPSREELSALSAGNLPETEIDRVADHVDNCADCRRSLAALEAAHDTLVAGLRGAAGATVPTLPPSFQRALEEAAASFDGPDLLARRIEPPGLVRIRDYELLNKLGEGGMGAVYKALHVNLKRLVAIKLLAADRLQDTQAVARFRREMEAVGKLVHPHIVLAHDAGEADGRHFLVMEYVDGIDLSQLVRRQGPLAPADACELIRQAAVGLDHAHRHGLVHRDLKPSNLMLTRDGQVKILDLGLALLLQAPTQQQTQPIGDELTAASQTMGTADYLAPEQINDSHHVDIRADVYSLGCTLFKLLTGSSPYAGPQFETSMKKMLAHLQAPIPRLRESVPDVPVELDAIVARMMAKTPAERFAAPAELVAALVPFAAGHDVAALAEEGVALAAPLPAVAHTLAETDAYRRSPQTGTASRVNSDVLPVESRVQETESAGAAPSTPHSASRTAHSPLPPRWRNRRVAIGTAGAAAALLLAGIVIVITNDRGEKTTIAVPGAATLDIQNDAGQTLAKIDASSPGVLAESSDADGRAAQWALDHGCTIAIDSGGRSEVMQPTEPLPAESFKLRSIEIGDNKQITDEDIKVLAGAGDLDRLYLLQLHGSQVTDAALMHIAKLKGLENLNLVSTAITDAGLHHLRDLPKLQHLALSGTRVTDWGLDEVVKIQSLRSLAVWQTAVTDDALLKIAGLPNLDSLSLATTHVTDDGLQRLDLDVHGPQGTGIGKLKELWISNTRITDRGVELIAKCKNLTLLDVAYTKITEKSLEHLKALKGLTRLRIEHVNVTPAALAALQAALPDCKIESELLASPVADPDRRVAEWALKLGGRVWIFVDGRLVSIDAREALPAQVFELSNIDFEKNEQITDTDFAEASALFGSLSKWTLLNLAGTKITDAALTQLSNATSLEWLLLDTTETSDAGLEYVKGLTNLRRVHLGGTKITDAGLRHLRGMTNLERLTLWGTRVTDWGLESLMELKNLREIHVYSTVVGDTGLGRLTALPKLESVFVGATQITDDGLTVMSGMPSLTQLVINHTHVTDDGLIHVAKMSNLADLNLLHTGVTDRGLEHLKSMLNLRRLVLRETRATASGVLALQTALSTCKIESDLLMPEQLAAASVLAVGGTLQVRIGDQIRNIASLDELPSEDFRIRLIGLQSMGTPADNITLQRLSELTDVEALVVTNSVITDEAVAILAHMPRLDTLVLVSPNLTDNGVQHMKNLKELRTLQVASPQITDAAMSIPRQLPNLKSLDVGGSAITNAGVEQLAQIPFLERVTLRNCTGITDRALEHLTRLGELESLCIAGTRITDAGLAHLAKIRKLKSLELYGSGVTDKGLAQLRGLSALEFLALSPNQISDAGLECLKELPSLKTLPLDASFDAARVAAIQRALPNCKVEWSGR